MELLREIPETTPRPTPLLFVHGLWHGAWCWAEHFLPYFARHGYESYAVSLRGHGSSPIQGSLRWASVADYVSDVAQAVQAIGAPPILIGHSMGGLVVQKFLEKFPMPAAVLLTPVPPRGAWGATLRVGRRQPLVLLKTILTMRLYPVVATPARARTWLFSPDIPADLLARYHARLQDDSFRVFLDMLGLNLPRPKRVSTPVLVVGAANDRVISVGDVHSAARAYGTQAVILPNTAHDIMLEPGWQLAAAKIVDWLAEREPARP